MTSITPIERVSELLAGANYRSLGGSLTVGTLSFDVPAAFIGQDRSSDLILIFDTAFHAGATIQQTVISIARCLDVARSRRPLTTVIVGPRPDVKVTETLLSVSRVLLAGDSQDYEFLRNALAILLPLTLPEVRSEAPDVSEVLRKLKHVGPIAEQLVSSSRDGEAAVRETFIALIEEPFASAQSNEGAK